jgi:hypothetical protein
MTRQIGRVVGIVAAACAVQWAIASVTILFGDSVRLAGHHVGLW